MQKCFVYTNDGYYAGEQIAYRRLPGNATFSPPPPRPWIKTWPRLVDGAWVMEEDHRGRPATLFESDAQEATPYWLPGDDWDSEPRKMAHPGPLPEGALLERPERPENELLEDAMERKINEITQGYDAALAASLTMPAENPTAGEIAIGAALFAAEDAEGLEYVQAAHNQRKAELIAQAKGAQSAEEAEAISVSYAV